MSYYPINLELKNCRVVVIGGGRIAARKVQGLLKAAAAGALDRQRQNRLQPARKRKLGDAAA